MIQFNLLPDVKLEFIKARRTKRAIAVVATIISISFLTVLVLLFVVVNVFQKKHLSDVNKDIAQSQQKLNGIKDLDKILTIQNQLNSLPALQAKKPTTSRLFSYLNQIIPTSVSLQKISVDFNTGVINFEGKAKDLVLINKFVDTLKFTNFNIDGGNDTKPAFSKVVLTSFSVTEDQQASYKINLIYDSNIFNEANNVKLIVPPNKITTRSETQKPTDLFVKGEK